MPIPTPKPGEDKNAYIGRCMTFLHTEESKKPENERRPQEQQAAICESSWEHKKMERKIDLQGNLEVKQLGNSLLLEGTLLRPGIWVGLDGVPTRYTESFINNVKGSLAGTPIYFAHDISPESPDDSILQGTPVGSWIEATDGGKLFVRGLVSNPKAMRYLRKHPNIGLSLEGVVHIEQHDTYEDALSGTLTGGALIENPACPTCRTESIRETNLERGNQEGKTMGNELIEFKADAKPDRDEFYKWLEKQLKDAGTADPSTIMTTIKNAIKTPYAYPGPPPPTQTLPPPEAIPKELSDYTEAIKTCMKGGKSMPECIVEVTKKAEKVPPTTETPSAELAQTKAELEATKTILNQHLQEENDRITDAIKQLDPEFDAKKLLEDDACKDLQRKSLNATMKY